MERPPAKTNAQRNVEFRLRKGDIINAKKREDRLANKAIITPQIVYEAPTTALKKIAQQKQATPPMPKGEHTKQTYISFIRQYYKRTTGEDLDENSDIIKKINEEKYNALNVSKQFKKLITDNLETNVKNPYEVNHLHKIFVGIRGFTDITNRLYPYVLEYAKQYEEKRSVAIVEDKAVLDIISFDPDDVNNNIEKIMDKTDKIIYGYIFMLKGRLNDLRLIKITTNKADISNPDYNYIYEDILYINNTKNDKPYIINLPSEFIRLYGDVSEGYLLGGLFAPSTLSQRLQKITKGVYGKVYTYLNIRHIYATQINAKGASLKEREETSRQAGHSVGQQLKYAYKVASAAET
jgi:hypothetical protein